MAQFYGTRKLLKFLDFYEKITVRELGKKEQGKKME